MYLQNIMKVVSSFRAIHNGRTQTEPTTLSFYVLQHLFFTPFLGGKCKYYVKAK